VDKSIKLLQPTNNVIYLYNCWSIKPQYHA
jgi:hypothetical protein